MSSPREVEHAMTEILDIRISLLDTRYWSWVCIIIVLLMVHGWKLIIEQECPGCCVARGITAPSQMLTFSPFHVIF